jgi:heptosyltransferase III
VDEHRTTPATFPGPVRILGWILTRCLSSPRARPDALPSVLVIRVDDRVGNVLLTVPLIRALKARFGSDRVEVLVQAGKECLLSNTTVHIFRKKDFFRRPIGFLRELCRIRRRAFDVALDASHWHAASATSALLLAWTGARMRIAHDRPGIGSFATHSVSIPENADSASDVETRLDLLKPLDIVTEDLRLFTELGSDDPDRNRVVQWLRSKGLEDVPRIAVLPGGRKPDHRAPLALFETVVHEGASSGAKTIVLWGPGEEALAQELVARTGAFLGPETDLGELAAFMRCSRLVVTNDTGPLHLSVACGATTIALFRNSNLHRWGHHYGPHRMISVADRPLDDVATELRTAVCHALQNHPWSDGLMHRELAGMKGLDPGGSVGQG